MPSADRPVLLWYRNDLRLADHAALAAAVASGRPVLPVFVLDTAAAGAFAPGGAARWWLHHSLAALTDSLAAAGAPLVLRCGAAARILPALAEEVDAEAVFAGLAPEPWAANQEAAVVAALAANGIAFRRFRTASLFRPDDLRTGAGGGYTVYTPFARAAHAAAAAGRGPAPPRPPPARIPAPPPPGSDPLASWKLCPSAPDWAGGLRATWRPGEAGARARLAAFLDSGLPGYAGDRDRPDRAATSALSPHLHWGEIAPATVWHAAAGDSPGAEKFRAELLWREFALHQLHHHPDLPERPLRAAFAAMPWRDDPAALAAWQQGRTGIPLVDAGMRQLWTTGWMHNRVRMVVASFLVKHLLLPWQAGAAWFWDTLVDADLAANAASWQWVAGCGADAAPYFRVFNPVLQGRKFDPDGAYVRRFVPELARLDSAFIHAPWEAPEPVLLAAGIAPGVSYPAPIVDLAAGRARALAAFAGLSAGAAA
ncbi:MAG: deoxyribodipyrimidine photo-lyase [Proteobacteria bacterium]|nr:deoxyribodipyrimidine photo-lyase [Pseudomonadota bacterium]